MIGPPGTGKTDVATQIINNIYHNFPEQRTLLIAHSNQALNQLFAKIVALDIDESADGIVNNDHKVVFVRQCTKASQVGTSKERVGWELCEES